MKRRDTILYVALAATLIATVWAARQDTKEPVAAVARPAKAVADRPSERVIERPSERPSERVSDRFVDSGVEKLIALEPRRIEDDGTEVFRVVAPVVAVKSTEPVVPVKPVAPPMPWKYVGRMVEGGVTVMLLSSGKNEVAVKVGDVIDHTYRIDEFGVKSIAVTYLPLTEKQSISLGE